MAKTNTFRGIHLLFGITFFAPVTYSIVVFEMDVVQRMFFFSISLLLFLVFVSRYRNNDNVPLNKFLSILIILFPFTFLTAFFNGSESLLLLKLMDLIIPLCILVQTALLISVLGEDKYFKVVAFSVVTVSTMFSIVGVLEVFQIKILPLPSVIPPGSTLGHRSFAAEYLLSSLPFILILNYYVKKERKFFLFITSIINVSFLLFTRNRSGMIILAVIVVLYIISIVLKNEKGNRIRSLLPVMAVLIISFLISLIPVKGTERPSL